MKWHHLAATIVIVAGCGSERASLAQDLPPSITRMQRSDLVVAPPAEPAPKVEGFVASKLRALVNGRPILDDELREAAWMMLREAEQFPEPQKSAAQKEVLQRELDKLIDRELLFGEAEDRLGKRPQVWAKLTDFSEKEFERQMRSMQQRANAKSEDELKQMLATQGMSLANLKRGVTRSFIGNEFMRSKIFPLIDAIGHSEIRRYFEEHPGEFQNDDRVKWQTMFIDADAPAVGGRDKAKELAENIADQLRKGGDFAALSDQHNMGESKYRKGDGLGQKRGQISPPDMEPVLFSMQLNEVKIIEMPTGFHILRVVERDFAGPQPFDEKTQGEIKRKLTNMIADREFKRIVKDLRRKAAIQTFFE